MKIKNDIANENIITIHILQLSGSFVTIRISVTLYLCCEFSRTIIF